MRSDAHWKGLATGPCDGSVLRRAAICRLGKSATKNVRTYDTPRRKKIFLGFGCSGWPLVQSVWHSSYGSGKENWYHQR